MDDALSIRLHALAKEYRIGEYEGGLGLLRRRAKRRPSMNEPNATTVWALKDVSFDVAQGEVVGVIGGNGAGKSTLLKIMSRITDPTSGYVDIAGRVGSLLEVGTGFHPDLSGRENVFLNGAILGMRRAEIRRSFSDIVDFAGVADFIDTPVKRYSSGMYVRLAFAVAAFLNPEILLVDEVLAVGDAEFQQRCLGRMGEVAREGRTVLLVSHNMQSIRSLCERAILLEHGRLAMDGAVDNVIRSYLAAATVGTSGRRSWSGPARPGDQYCRVAEVRVTTAQGEVATTLPSSHPIRIYLEVDVERVHPAVVAGIDVLTADGAHVFRSFQSDAVSQEATLMPGRSAIFCEIPGGFLNGGRYVVNLRVAEHLERWVVHEDGVLQFDVVFDHGPPHYLSGQARPGAIAPMLRWGSASPAAANDAGGTMTNDRR